MAGKKRGMSLEEKRNTLLDIFHETKEVYVLKDIEKLGSKRGVVLQSIKDVLQGLVDDDLVHQEKIGISNYFWSFPSEAAVKLDNELNKLTAQSTKNAEEIATLKEQVAKSKLGKDNTEERRKLQQLVDQFETEFNDKVKELELYAANDPERFEALKQSLAVCKDSANRWTDNVFTLQSWMKKKFPGMDKQLADFCKQQGVGADFDYVE